MINFVLRIVSSVNYLCIKVWSLYSILILVTIAGFNWLLSQFQANILVVQSQQSLNNMATHQSNILTGNYDGDAQNVSDGARADLPRLAAADHYV
jgi:hypothetical protein